jgi:hypothetical protein
MTEDPTDAPISLDRQQAQSLVTLLREVEQFLDECDENVEEALAAHFGLNPASEAFSAALCFHADVIAVAIAAESAVRPAWRATGTRRKVP